jgi:hypothetical protein
MQTRSRVQCIKSGADRADRRQHLHAVDAPISDEHDAIGCDEQLLRTLELQRPIALGADTDGATLRAIQSPWRHCARGRCHQCLRLTQAACSRRRPPRVDDSDATHDASQPESHWQATAEEASHWHGGAAVHWHAARGPATEACHRDHPARRRTPVTRRSASASPHEHVGGLPGADASSTVCESGTSAPSATAQSDHSLGTGSHTVTDGTGQRWPVVVGALSAMCCTGSEDHKQRHYHPHEFTSRHSDTHVPNTHTRRKVIVERRILLALRPAPAVQQRLHEVRRDSTLRVDGLQRQAQRK